ncbi:MAG: TIGR02757 family protein [Myxococcales bacterium]|nr:TIGR02757 family protein [Myxococcales bacterium]
MRTQKPTVFTPLVDPTRLGEILERLRRAYGPEHLASDPLEFSHRFGAPEDREVVALISSALAYGSAPQIRAGLQRIFDWMGPHPARFVMEMDPARELRRFAGFKHRWNSGADVVALAWAIGRMREEAGSIGGFFASTHDPEEPTIRGSMSRFVRRALALDMRGVWPRGKAPVGSYYGYFFPDAARGSSCKRLCLFLRWVVRPADGVDLGLWPNVGAHQLVIPLDTHVARIATYLGLTSRKTHDWIMAEEITAALRAFDPRDPVKYDFAISRLGILDLCTRRVVPDRCRVCYIRDACAIPGRWSGDDAERESDGEGSEVPREHLPG